MVMLLGLFAIFMAVGFWLGHVDGCNDRKRKEYLKHFERMKKRENETWKWSEK